MASRREFVERVYPQIRPVPQGTEGGFERSICARPVFLFGLLAANDRKTAHVLHAGGCGGKSATSCTILAFMP